ncbi:YhgE/Pip domain-containing protein [Collinsella tanakaei]|uniref:YhgE/Pip family protein n=1 Tax=Collinsella tanakaei TaxID=626935 RepID=UPI00195B0485|nr:YhgE/Pip domain-containing protein [Collinsella tanakaei]
MNTVLRIFVRDLKRIVRNPAAIVIALGVCIIPSLYAWINILANWNPYENTGTVPVAVVIEDEGTTIPDMGFVNAGSMIREKLEENHQLGWEFAASEDEAISEVEAGHAYAAFVIPRDFSATLAGVLDGKTEPTHLAYYVNEKANAIAPKVTDTGATTLETQIESEFLHVVGDTVADKLKGSAASMANDADQAVQSTAGKLHSAADGLTAQADSLDDAQRLIDSSRKAVDGARASLDQISSSADTLAGSLDHAMGVLGDARAGTQALATDLAANLGTGAGAIAGISSTAAYDIGEIAGDIGWAQGKIDAAITQIRSLNGTVQNLKTSLELTRTTIVGLEQPEGQDGQSALQTQVVKQLDQEIQVLISLSDEQLAQLDRLQALSDDIKASADDVRNLSGVVNDAIQQGNQALSGLQTQLATVIGPGVSSALDTFADAGGYLEGTLNSIGPLTSQANSTLDQLDTLLQQGADTIDQTAASLREAAGGIGDLASDLDALESAQTFRGLSDLIALDPTEVGSFMGAPVALNTHAVFPVSTYGSGVAPFYTNLALWVGGFVLVAIYKLEVDTEGIGTIRPWQGFFGRWLLLALLGQVQAIVCCTGDIVLGVQCVSPVAYIFAGMVESLVYVLFVYALAVAFKHIGKALGVLLVVLQIPGTSGTYPIEMMPGFFQALHPWLPFTYGIDAMREAVAGFYGDTYLRCLATLLLFAVPALIIGVGARRHLVGINTLFDRRLAETDLMIAEHTGAEDSLAAGSERFASAGIWVSSPGRAQRFERHYPVLVRRGLFALAAVPAALLLALFVLPAKFALLICWIASLASTCAYLIVVEYLHSRALGVIAGAVPQRASRPRHLSSSPAERS